MSIANNISHQSYIKNIYWVLKLFIYSLYYVHRCNTELLTDYMVTLNKYELHLQCIL